MDRVNRKKTPMSVESTPGERWSGGGTGIKSVGKGNRARGSRLLREISSTMHEVLGAGQRGKIPRCGMTGFF